MSSAYGTREEGRHERIPVVGGLYRVAGLVEGGVAECCVVAT